jgi:hypothetical protein
MPAQALGDPRASGLDADLADPGALWFASSHFLPGMGWDDPNVDIPLFAFESIAMDTGVADSGSCPYEQIDGMRTTWRSDCRSTQGYNWTGRMVRERWSEGGVDYTRWESDLEVEGDTVDPEFQRLSIQGAWVYASGDDVDLVTGIQANVQVQLDGYWSRASAGDPREAAWQDWAWTGREELRSDGARRLEGTARLAGVGTFGLQSTDLRVTDACRDAPTGSVTMTGTSAITLRFHGESDCRKCADIVGGPADGTEACAR